MDLISEAFLRDSVFALVRLVEAAAALVIFAGAAVGFVRFSGAVLLRRVELFTPVRLDVGRFLALGLEFQLASDLLRTAVAPSFTEIGKLAAVATIRTALNFFLAREIRLERKEVEQRSRERETRLERKEVEQRSREPAQAEDGAPAVQSAPVDSPNGRLPRSGAPS